MEIFYVLTKYVQSRLLQNCRMRERVKPEVKLYGGKGDSRMRMKGNWTKNFSEKVNEIKKGCILTFKWHNVKKHNSRKISPAYFTASAVCTGMYCNGKYNFTVGSEPNDKETVHVSCSVKGKIKHIDQEVNRRNITGDTRLKMGEEILKAGTYNVFNKNLLASNTDSLDQGNYTNVPNLAVLRKIISEQINKDHLNPDIFSELKLLKESYANESDPYIRDIGLDPFCIILFSSRQIEVFRKYSSTRSIHIDATGSVVMNIPGQKIPYLYSMVMRPVPGNPPFSIADMVTTEHCIPRIEFFLSTVLRAAKMTGKHIEISQIETDFSYALMQAALKAFNDMQVKRYLSVCYTNLCKDNCKLNFTVLHLCAAHFFKDFCRNLKKVVPLISKKTKLFAYRTFAILQNTITLDESKVVFHHMCNIFLEQKLTNDVQKSIEILQNKMNNMPTLDFEDKDDLPEMCANNDDDNLIMDTYKTTIKESSPFQEVFMNIRNSIQIEVTEGKDDNAYFCKGVINCLLERFMFLLPLWTGVMLSKTFEGQSRNTNSDVEGWFKVLKNDCLKAKGNRPGKFVIQLKKLVFARMLELDYPDARKSKTKTARTRKEKTLHDISLKEEVWDRRKKTNTKYQPDCRSKVHTQTAFKDLPQVPTWGGQLGEHLLANTCTIDNGLTILYLKCLEIPGAEEKLRAQNCDLFDTLLSIFSVMKEECFPSAKLMWINFIKKTTPDGKFTNLHGDESDYFFSFFHPEWKSTVKSICLEKRCPQPYKESGEILGITVSLEKPVKNTQEIIDKWVEGTTTCLAPGESFQDEISILGITGHCTGTRVIRRTVHKYSPVLILRVVEHCEYKRITLNQILDQLEIHVNGKTYTLAGCTLHRSNHFCAIVSTASRGNLWYDGLEGRLLPIVKDIHTWAPCHVVYVEM